MGKSTAALILRERNLPVIDTDEIARELVEPGTDALEEIRRRFSALVITAEGRLDRAALAGQVFADPEKRSLLESILHPRIRAAWLEEVARWRSGKRDLGIVVIPLLFETKAESHFDQTICIACSKATQNARLQERGWSREQIDLRTQAQLPVAEKVMKSNYVVWTEGSQELHRRQLDRIIRS